MCVQGFIQRGGGGEEGAHWDSPPQNFKNYDVIMTLYYDTSSDLQLQG